jgi:hypothetical protein
MRLNTDIRNMILKKAMASVPSINYHPLMAAVVQNVLRDHMPLHIQMAYDDLKQRPYLNTFSVRLREGNYGMTIRDGSGCYGYQPFYGHPTHRNDLCIRVDGLGHHAGPLHGAISDAIIASGYYAKHKEQEELLSSVKSRLLNTLRSVTTVKRLYDVLEPELHHLIPKEGDKSALLPAVAAPVVDDLRKLGADLPTTPKAK